MEERPGTWIECPLFISSTFCDMQVERDGLQLVLGDLQRSLREACIRLVPIDLRSGIDTVDLEEQAEKDLMVLRVCLEEIDKARSFMLVLLGDRYGTVPEREHVRRAASEKGLSLDCEGKSVTALEIEYGLLRNPDATRAIVLVRDLDYEGMPAQLRELHDDRAAGRISSAASLAALKDELRSRLGPDRCPPPYAAHWNGKRVVLADDWAAKVRDLVAKLFEPLRSARIAQLDPSPLAVARREVGDFIEEHGRCFVGREAIVAELTAFARHESTGGPWGRCLVGSTGNGKSAVLSALARALGASDESPPPTAPMILAHAASSAPGAGSPLVVLRRWCAQLAARLPGSPGTQHAELSDVHDLREAFATLLTHSANARVPVVILIDALDQLNRTRETQEVSWLPQELPPHVRLIATAAPGEAAVAFCARTGVERLDLPELAPAEAAAMVRAIFAARHQQPNDRVVSALLSRSGVEVTTRDARALWLHVATERLLLLDRDDFDAASRFDSLPGDARVLQRQLDVVAELPHEVGALHEAMFARADRVVREHHQESFTPRLLELLAVSRAGLRESDLRALLSLSSGRHDLAFATAQRLLRSHGGQRGSLRAWDFLHQTPRIGLCARLERSGALRQRHSELAEHLLHLDPSDPLHVTDTMFHLLGAGDLRRARQYLGRERTPTEIAGAAQVLVDQILLGIAADPVVGPEGRDTATELLRGLLNHPEEPATAIAAGRVLFHVLPALSGRATGSVVYALAEACVDCLEDAWEASPLDRTRHALMEGYRQMAGAIDAEKSPAAAVTLAERSLIIARELRAGSPRDPLRNHDLAAVCACLGDTLMQAGRREEACTCYVEALRALKSVPEAIRNDPALCLAFAGTAERVGEALAQFQASREAREAFEHAESILLDLAAKPDASAQVRSGLALLHEKLARLDRAEGHVQAARGRLDAAIVLLERLVSDEPLNANWRRILARLRAQQDSLD